MKQRPLCVALSFYIIGILMGLYLKRSIALICVSISFVILVCYLYHRQKQTSIFHLWGFTLFLLFAIFYLKTIDQQYENVYQLLDNQEIVVEGIITTQKQEKEYSNSYQLTIQTINGKKMCQGKQFILNVRSKEVTLEQGDLITVTGKYEKPQGARNYGGFDYRKYLKSQKLYGTITTKETVKVLKKNQNSLLHRMLIAIQNKIKENMKDLLPEETEDICLGILIGDKTELSEDIVETFQKSNLIHMLAVSGAHISYVIVALTGLLNKTGKKCSKIATIFFLFFFMALTNFTPSVMRASIMAMLELLSGLLYRKSDVYQNLALSSLIILIINPYTLFNQGFQLSFAGTLGIVYFSKRLSACFYEKIEIKKKILKNIVDNIIVTVSANLAILPMMAYQFNTISLTFWISNLLASPFMGVIMIFGFLTFFLSLIFFPIAKVLAILLHMALMGLLKVSQICSILPFSSILVKTPHALQIFLYYFLIMLWREKTFGLLLKIKKQILIFLCIVVIVFSSCSFFITDSLHIYFIDVGQGDSCLIVTPHHKTILIDGGGSEIGSFDVGENTLVPYLLDRRIKTLDYIIISHFDTDHVGGILTVLEKLTVKTVIIAKQGENSSNYQTFKRILTEKKIKVMIVGKEDRISIEDNVWLDILWPDGANLIKENVLNNNSLVCKFHYQNFSMLLTGDIEEVAEKQILQEYGYQRTKYGYNRCFTCYGIKSTVIMVQKPPQQKHL